MHALALDVASYSQLAIFYKALVASLFPIPRPQGG